MKLKQIQQYFEDSLFEIKCKFLRREREHEFLWKTLSAQMSYNFIDLKRC